MVLERSSEAQTIEVLDEVENWESELFYLSLLAFLRPTF
jgi:hypothetical protein